MKFHHNCEAICCDEKLRILILPQIFPEISKSRRKSRKVKTKPLEIIKLNSPIHERIELKFNCLIATKIIVMIAGCAEPLLFKKYKKKLQHRRLLFFWLFFTISNFKSNFQFMHKNEIHHNCPEVKLMLSSS